MNPFEVVLLISSAAFAIGDPDVSLPHFLLRTSPAVYLAAMRQAHVRPNAPLESVLPTAVSMTMSAVLIGAHNGTLLACLADPLSLLFALLAGPTTVLVTARYLLAKLERS